MISELQDNFYVASMPLGPINTNSHILYRNDEALIIDAPLQSLAAIGNFLAQKKLKARTLLLTHGHWDHMGGAAALRQNLQLHTWAGRHDQILLQNPQLMRAFADNIDLQPVIIDRQLDLDFAREDKRFVEFFLEWLDFSLKIIAYAMPGHTPGGVAFYFPQAACVMSGDQLFCGSVGRSDFPGGDFALLAASIRQSLYSLPAATVVFPGHGAATTIGREMQYNPFVRP